MIGWRATARLALVGWGVCAHAGDAPPAFESGMAALQEGNYAEAYCLWQPLAARGYAEAQYNLGWLYANGNGLAVDIDRAIEFWREAAEQGHADAQFAIGLAYTTGEGLGKDLDEAVTWYVRAARQGHLDAREILVRLNGDRDLKLLQNHPELADEDWFGWPAVVTGERINVRSGPGTSHAIVIQLTKGTRVRVIGRRGEWYMVVLPSTDDGSETTAWIFKRLLSEAG
jgi:TPR repeat protein